MQRRGRFFSLVSFFPSLSTIKRASQSIVSHRLASPSSTLASRASSEMTTPAAEKASCCAPTAAAVRSVGGYDSPLESMREGPREKLLYIPCVLHRHGKEKGAQNENADYLATVDVDENSPTFSTVVHRLPMPRPGDELHHMGWNACSSCRDRPGIEKTHAFLVIPGVVSGDIHFVDVSGENALAPKLSKTVSGEELRDKVGVALPHTSHCAPDSIIVSFMGSKKETGDGGFEFSSEGNGFVELDPSTFEIKGRWEPPEQREKRKGGFGYDFWYQLNPAVDCLVSSEWGDPRSFLRGFDPTAPGFPKQWGSKLYFWSYSRRELLQEIDLGPGTIPLEVRFLHRPDAAEGYVGCALSSEMVRFVREEGKQLWEAKPTIKVPPVDVVNWALPSMPALITDFVVSLDDRYLFLACWLHGEVRQYDIASDPDNPRLVSKVEGVGGLLHSDNRGGVSRADGSPRPAPVVVKGVRVRGGAQMIQLSLDGRRLYVSTSLFSSWDEQFYGEELTREGGQLLRILVDGERGMRVDETFLVDFGSEPWGAALAHEMRFPGGDCTSDIWK